MTATKPINIVGGGLAGLTLGIGLRQRGVPVTLWEAGHYPRHRVCGEFISGRGQETLTRLGLLEPLVKAGATLARTVEFSSAKTSGRVKTLPEAALCLPRKEMDALLAGQFREMGGELREGERWRAGAELEGVVLASGRRVQPTVDGWRWFGLKAHAKGVDSHADLEMHLSSDGYVGLCRQTGGIVNVCGLFRRGTASNDHAANWQDQLQGATGSVLRERMKNAAFVADSFCAVAGINLEPQRASGQTECRIGDALTMVPPVTGNGMSMAFESAEMSIEPLNAFAKGGISWTHAQRMIAEQCDATFSSRLAWAKWFQRLVFTPVLQNPLVAFFSRNDWAWKRAFEWTR